jgi:hypothetical protein
MRRAAERTDTSRKFRAFPDRTANRHIQPEAEVPIRAPNRLDGCDAEMKNSQIVAN